MKYEKVTIIFWNYDKGFKICFYTTDGIYYIIIKYKYNFFKTKKEYYIFNRLDVNYIIDYYKNKYKNINIYLKYVKNNKTYIIRTIHNLDKIKVFFYMTEIDPPPPYKRLSITPYDFLNVYIPISKLDLNF